MIEKYVAPSKLHLKKELIALQNAPTLRDPETYSTLRSPHSFKSFSAYNLHYENEIRDASTRENISSALLEVPHKSEKSRKKVYLYNWKSYSSKSSEGGINLDEDGKQPSVESFHEDIVSNFHNEEILGELLSAANICNHRDEEFGTTTPRRSGIRLKKAAILNKRVRKHASTLKHPGVLSSPVTVLSSVEQPDGTGHCNSEVAQYLQSDFLCKSSQHSPCASSQFSGSGCTNWTQPSKIFKNARRDGSPHSCTPASTSSYYRRLGRIPSTAGSWCGTTASFEGDQFDQLDLPVRQGCGLPCYWSMRTKDRVCGVCCSPSLCDTTEKVGDTISCGSWQMYNANKATGLRKPKPPSKSSRGSLLSSTNYVRTSSDKSLSNLGELNLEALSRLDGRKCSNSNSQEPFEVAGSRSVTLDITDNKSLCVKYKPKIFDELVGQSVVVKSLMNAVLRKKIAPAYLFHGPRGTGKTSAARIFSAALNCLATEGHKPCCLCMACTAFYGGSGSFVKEVSATDKKGINSIRYLLKNMTITSRLLQYRILIIDECHLLTSKMWSSFLRFLEEPFPHVVFIFLTVDRDNLPGAILSRCRKYQFSKIKDADVVHRLRKLSAAENLDVEIDALNLIAVNSDGSLQDAETMLYQLSLLGEKITNTLVNDVVGVVSDEKLLDLLELAMSSKTEEMVRLSRELLDSGVDPTILTSKLAGIVMDIISGTYQLAHSHHENVVLGRRSLTKDEVKRLQQALKILSDTEKQLKQSTEHSSLLTTALLQLASVKNMESTQLNTVGEYANQIQTMKKISSSCNRAHNLHVSQESGSLFIPSQRCKKSTPSIYHTFIRVPRTCDSNSSVVPENIHPTNGSSPRHAQLDYSATGNPWKLSEIWKNCIEKCYSRALRQFLSSHGRLISITENDGILIAFIAFTDSTLKLRAERYMSSITNSLEMVLKQNVEVRMGIVPGNWKNLDQARDSLTVQYIEKSGLLNNERKIVADDIRCLPEKYDAALSFPRKSRDSSVGAGQNKLARYSNSLPQNGDFQLESCSVSYEGNANSSCTKEKGMEVSFHKAHLPFSTEKRLENAWLQDAEKGIQNLSRTDTSLMNHQNSGSSLLYHNLMVANDRTSRHWEGETNHENEALETNDILCQYQAKSYTDKNQYTISPSKPDSVSSRTNFDQQNLEYESGPGCNGLFCWKTNKSRRLLVKQASHQRTQRSSRVLSFRKQVKSKIGRNRRR